MKEKTDVVYMKPKEVKNMKHTVEIHSKKKFVNRDLAIIAIGTTIGLRVSAISNMDVDDIDFENRTIKVVEKGNVKRIVYFGQETKDILTKWFQDREMIVTDANMKAVFVNPSGKRLSRDGIYEMIKRTTEKAGIDKHITPHKMRSTCAMNLYNKTGDIYLVQQQLGHKNIKNTMIYAKASDDKKREASSILDSLF